MLCLVDVFIKTVGIPMGTNYAPLLSDLFIYSYKGYFITGILKKRQKKLVRSSDFTFRYADDILNKMTPWLVIMMIASTGKRLVCYYPGVTM